MDIKTDEIKLSTSKPVEILDITDQVKALVRSSGVRDGLITIMSRHTTAAININEMEDGLLGDMVDFLNRIAPKDGEYRHNLTSADGRNNAHSHLLALFGSASQSVPVKNGELMIGTWQSIFFIELDGPRFERKVTVQILG